MALSFCLLVLSLIIKAAENEKPDNTYLFPIVNANQVPTFSAVKTASIILGGDLSSIFLRGCLYDAAHKFSKAEKEYSNAHKIIVDRLKIPQTQDSNFVDLIETNQVQGNDRANCRIYVALKYWHELQKKNAIDEYEDNRLLVCECFKSSQIKSNQERLMYSFERSVRGLKVCMYPAYTEYIKQNLANLDTENKTD